MANRKGKRSFGNVRKRPSGRWQARYRGPDGQLHSAPNTFATKREAEQWLTRTEAAMLSGDWTSPERSRITLFDYATRWIEERADLRPRTRELYRWLFRRHLAPHLGGVELGKLSTAMVRSWRSDRLSDGVSATMVAKSYRLLRSVLNTAVEEDRIVSRNPCRIRGADQENATERPVLTVAQVFDLASRMPYERFRVLVLLAAFCTLRWGEVSALRRKDIAEDASWVRVSVTHTEVKGQGLTVGPPKSRAGARTVTVPEALRPEVLAHLETYVTGDSDALVFTGPRGAALRRGNFNQLVDWRATVDKLGVPELHFHDLRHTGNHFAARSGASTKELMARMGHDDMRAALIYQRATSEADRQIADRVSGMVEQYRYGDSSADENSAADDDSDG